MKTITIIISLISALCYIAVSLCLSLQLFAFSMPFYKYEYNKLDVARSINISPDSLLSVTSHMLDYLRGKEENLNIRVVVGGQEREFFNEREIAHMVDVKDLFIIGIKARNTLVGLLFATFILLALLNNKKIVFAVYRNVLSGFIIAVAALTVIVSINFDRAFRIFHKIFFTNDLWILDPNTDLLINIVPLNFFIDIATYILAVFTFLILGALAISWFCLKKIAK